MPNHLANETSPYLLLHANNPVDWHAWNESALNKARDNNKPILLSIGYSACHWCHVMERESFEDETIAKIMNENFVCIKVDREERPDLDKIYQLAHQMLTERPGGWPLTMVLTPDGHAPFFAGTYFPPELRYNMPGFGEILKKISGHYNEHSEKLTSHHQSFNNALTRLNPTPGSKKLPDTKETLQKAVDILTSQYDSEYGGFGNAPKFPHPTQLELLLIVLDNSESKTASDSKEMLKNSLDRMVMGGLFDQLGGGFFRYSVDRKWQIPHFEKMLYDNAQLLGLYSDASIIFPDTSFKTSALATANWVISEMQQPGGGYSSTLDADSEGVEGKYYVWSETDLRALLTEQEYSLIENYFGLFGEENFEGNWHFNLNPDTDQALLNNRSEVLRSITDVKQKLLDVRGERIRPALDDKILSAWNGLMIKGMAKAGRIFDEPGFIESAQNSVDFVHNNMWQGNHLLAACAQGKAHLNGYLDDYAFMLDGIMELLQSRWRDSDLNFAILIADTLVERFEDADHGGFYFTSHDHEQLLYRPKTGADDAIPSGNAGAILGLFKLGSLLGETRYLESAGKALEVFSDELNRHPSVNSLMTIGLQYLSDGHATVVIRGEHDEIETWKRELFANYKPFTNIFAIDIDAQKLPPTLALRKAEKQTVAYICKGMHCTPPIKTLEELLTELT